MTFGVRTAAEAFLEPAMGELSVAQRHLEEALLTGDDQEAIRSEILAFTRRHPDALYRSCLAGHLTGSGVVVDRTTGRSLLIRHAKLGRWLQPGGHADGDGNLAAVAWREATEETGLKGLAVVTPALDVDIHAIPARADEPEHLHLDLRFLVLAGATTEPSPNHETLGARWMDPTEPEVASSAELGRAVRRAVEIAALVST